MVIHALLQRLASAVGNDRRILVLGEFYERVMKKEKTHEAVSEMKAGNGPVMDRSSCVMREEM